ncbi:MAG: hypothetical protein AB1609_21255 [Bacillota bacterium]
MERHRHSEIKTEFVKRELRRTRWDRGYIHTLMLIEELYAQGGARHMAEGTWPSHVSREYPAAVHAIKSELIYGKVLSDEELMEWMAERQREKERKRKAWEEERRRIEQEGRERERMEREEWLEIGGLP